MTPPVRPNWPGVTTGIAVAFLVGVPIESTAAIVAAATIDLRMHFPPYNQGQIDGCVGIRIYCNASGLQIVAASGATQAKIFSLPHRCSSLLFGRGNRASPDPP
jgi:hypothetical protein